MRRTAAVSLVVALISVGCATGLESGVEPIELPLATDLDAPTTEIAGLEGSATSAGVEAETESRIASTALGTIAVLDAPGGNEVTTLDATTTFGSPTTLLVLEDQPGWLQVALPIEPNGQTGWVSAESVTLARVRHRVEVDLEARQLTVFHDDVELLRTTVAIGSNENPTPVGTELFVTDVLQTPGEDSAYGPFALGLSLFSETLSEFGGGDGQIGIHGTNDPASIGQAVSHGCVRVPNEVVTQLAGMLPLGTPVAIS